MSLNVPELNIALYILRLKCSTIPFLQGSLTGIKTGVTPLRRQRRITLPNAFGLIKLPQNDKSLSICKKSGIPADFQKRIKLLHTLIPDFALEIKKGFQ